MLLTVFIISFIHFTWYRWTHVCNVPGTYIDIGKCTNYYYFVVNGQLVIKTLVLTK